MYLFLDALTTANPMDWDNSEEEIFRWPRLVQLAWLQMDARANLLDEGNDVIQPEGFDIPSEAIEFHGIATMQASMNGNRLVDVLIDLAEIIDESKMIVGHNVDFQANVLFGEYKRENIPTAFSRKPRICTMNESIDLCEIPENQPIAKKNSEENDEQSDEGEGEKDDDKKVEEKSTGKFRAPTVAELHKALFETAIEENTDIANNVRACAKCFFELRNRGVVSAMM